MRFRHVLFCALVLLFASHVPFVMATERTFSEVAFDLPSGWDGDERAGFITGNRDEYMVSLGKKDEKGETYLAQLTIYILPNTQSVTSVEAAQKLAKDQDDSTSPVEEKPFWKFSGYPQSNILKGMAVTYVVTNNEWLCIIISQNPDSEEGQKIVASLKGKSERARALLLR